MIGAADRARAADRQHQADRHESQVGKLDEHKVGKDGNIVLGPAFHFNKDNIDSFNF